MATITNAKKQIILDEEEREYITIAYKILCDLREDLYCEDIHSIVNLETHECIEEPEWSRFLGILEGLAYNSIWEEE